MVDIDPQAAAVKFRYLETILRVEGRPRPSKAKPGVSQCEPTNVSDITLIYGKHVMDGLQM